MNAVRDPTTRPQRCQKEYTAKPQRASKQPHLELTPSSQLARGGPTTRPQRDHSRPTTSPQRAHMPHRATKGPLSAQTSPQPTRQQGLKKRSSNNHVKPVPLTSSMARGTLPGAHERERAVSRSGLGGDSCGLAPSGLWCYQGLGIGHL